MTVFWLLFGFVALFALAEGCDKTWRDWARQSRWAYAFWLGLVSMRAAGLLMGMKALEIVLVGTP